MTIRFYNARVLPMVHGIELLENGEVWVKEDQITYVGPARMTDTVFDREINANGNLLLPGFKNAHTHSAMTFLRSLADDLPLDQWLHQQVFPREAKLTPEDTRWLAKLANLEYLTSGITANFDMYLFPMETARASVEMGFRTVLCSGLNSFSSSIAQVEREYQTLNRFDPLITYRLGFHGEYTATPELLEQLSALVNRFHAPVSTHCAETASEVQGCYSRHAKTPPAYLDSMGLFQYGGTCFHCVHVTPADIQLFSRRGIIPVTNPASNLKLASGIAPLTDFAAEGLTVAIGTDGAASNNCLDFFREMFLAATLQKLRLNDAAAMDAGDVLIMATVGGAKAMGLTDCDCLMMGKKADLVMIDLQQPNMQPIHHVIKNLVYSGSKQNVALTMVNGRILYENGKFSVGCAPEEIYTRVNRITRRIREESR